MTTLRSTPPPSRRTYALDPRAHQLDSVAGDGVGLEAVGPQGGQQLQHRLAAGVSSGHAKFGEAHPAEHKPPAARGSSREGTGKNTEDQCEPRRCRPDRGWSGGPGTGEETVPRSCRSAGARVDSGGGETAQGRAGAHDLRRVTPKIQWTNLPPCPPRPPVRSPPRAKDHRLASRADGEGPEALRDLLELSASPHPSRTAGELTAAPGGRPRVIATVQHPLAVQALLAYLPGARPPASPGPAPPAPAAIG